MTIEVWHTHQARSMRVLWALEEMGENLKIDERYKPKVREFLSRMKERPAFQKVAKIGEEFIFSK
ncbi:hypothetical protein HBA55_35205 [Pseudomaricurvus alkylphenolicus]|uniref:hypothetical protein n=1 Tax=Pseudomaricurvus alkylphenolicus TaxID=1306991 RepID=UPI00142455B9|nr:hypothetical protein [Pseudomaricurvus alkylphenolicus]NIB44880.1 hypothetical protein [Pseudomaricurvus alkylphenolicus]